MRAHLVGRGLALVETKFKRNASACCFPIWRVSGAGTIFRGDDEGGAMSNAGMFISQFLAWRINAYNAKEKEIRSLPYRRSAKHEVH